jgi:hypothetical protein
MFKDKTTRGFGYTESISNIYKKNKYFFLRYNTVLMYLVLYTVYFAGSNNNRKLK